MVHFRPFTEMTVADFLTHFLTDFLTNFGIFLSFKSVGKSFGGTYALHNILLNALNIENVVSATKNTISLVLIVIAASISFNRNEAHILDLYCKISKFKFQW